MGEWMEFLYFSFVDGNIPHVLSHLYLFDRQDFLPCYIEARPVIEMYHSVSSTSIVSQVGIDSYSLAEL